MKYAFTLIVFLIFSLDIISQENFKYLTNFQFDYINSYSDGMTSVRIGDWGNGKYGFVDKTGQLVIDCQYDNVSNFSEGLAAVKKNDLYGFINKSGNVVIDFKYSFASGFSEGLAVVGDGSKYGYIDKSGNLVIDYKFNSARIFSEGLAVVGNGNKYGYIDKTGKLVIDYKFDVAEYFIGDYAVVMANNYKWNLTNKLGKLIFNSNLTVYHADAEIHGIDVLVQCYNNGYTRVIKDNKFGYVNRNGELVIDYQYDHAGLFKKEVASVVKNGKHFLINRKGDIISANQYDLISEFFEGLASVRKGDWSNGKAGFIDEFGNLIIDYQFDYARDFLEGFAAVNKNKMFGFINKSGEMVVDFQFDYVTRLSEGYCAVQKDKKYALIKLKIKDEIDTKIPISSLKNEKTFALVIGNESYSNEISVPYAHNDAQIFSKYCTKTLGIPENQVHLLLDGSYGQILGELNWLSNIIDVFEGEAKIIVYYAGHGMLDGSSKSTFILPIDGNATIPETGVSLDNIYLRLGSNSTKSVSIFLDACFSGAARNGMLLSGRGVRIQPKEIIVNGNLIVFSATDGAQTALPYEDKEHGLFTYFLLKKLNETKGQVTFGELSDYLIQNVKQQSIIINQKLQTPKVNVGVSMEDKWNSLKF